MKAAEPKSGEVKEKAKNPAAFLVEYGDGLRATVLMLQGYVSEFAFAAHLKGEEEPLYTRVPFGE